MTSPTLHDPWFLLFAGLHNRLSLSGDETSDLTLKNRIGQRWGVATPMVTFANRFALTHSLPGCSEEANCHVVNCLWRGSHGREPWWGASRSWEWSPANSQQKRELYFLQSRGAECWWQNHVSEEVDPSPVKPWMRPQPQLTL